MMKSITHFIIIALASTLPGLFCPAISLYAQEGEDSKDSLYVSPPVRSPEQGVETQPDTGDARDPDQQLIITGETVVQEEGYVPTKSPWGAALRSALLPGLGQFYNEAYWKIPIVVGVTGALVYGYIYENKNLQHYSDLYDESITEENPDGDLTLKRYREFYRGNRDSYATWIVITYLIQIADAFVDAHLYDFDVSDEVQGSVGIGPGTLNLQLRW